MMNEVLDGDDDGDEYGADTVRWGQTCQAFDPGQSALLGSIPELLQ